MTWVEVTVERRGKGELSWVVIVNGKVAVPQAPGIGVEIDRDVLSRYGRVS